MTDVFVSYKAEDRRRVRILVDALEADGLSVWWDTHVGSGDDWRDAIQTELDAAKCVVVVWSKRSVGPEGKFVRDEASRAERRHAYIPIRIDKVEPPLGFGETQALLFAGWSGNRSDPRYQSLLNTLRAVIAGRALPAYVDVAGPVLSRRTAMVGGAAAVVAAVASGWLLFRPAPAAASNRIAVLTFANLSGDPAQAYFSDGISEELRSYLSRAGMQVVGRASSDAVKDFDTKTAARKLGVANILSGSVRRSPSAIRIDAQLLSGSDGVERWEETYDRAPGDAIKIQADIAENVAEALSIALSDTARKVLTLGGTANPSAQNLILQATNVPSDSETDYDRRLALVEAALSLDPNYAEAYASKASIQSGKAVFHPRTAAESERGLTDALASANRAIAIEPNMADAFAVRAAIYVNRLQMGLALADFRRAAALPGESGGVISGYAFLLGLAGQFDESLRMSAKAISLDPLNPSRYGNRAIILYVSRRYSEAVSTARRALELNPDLQRFRAHLGNALLAQGKTAEAEAEYRKLDPTNYNRLVGEAAIAARVGQRAQALDKLRAVREQYGDSGHYQYSEIYAQVGMTEDALRELDLAWNTRDSGLTFLRVDPFLDPLRKASRYAALERKIGFP
ncbi:MAG TPA: TIR domain-containing protein [Sphingomicrobium sp.]